MTAIRSICDGAPHKLKKVSDCPISIDSRTTICLYLCTMRKLISNIIIHLSSIAGPIQSEVKVRLTLLNRLWVPINWR